MFMPRTSFCSPMLWYTRSSRAASRSRPRWGINWRSPSRRSSLSPLPGVRSCSMALRATSMKRAVLHPGGAGGFAGAAGQTAVEVRGKATAEGIGRNPAFSGGPHQRDAAAGAIHFCTEEGVGGAGFQAHTTVDALVQFGVIGWAG